MLPAAGCGLPVPKWPAGRPSPAEAALWKSLWTLPIACWWHEQRIAPHVVARYVSIAVTTPTLATLSRLESDLGLSPGGMLRMRLLVEAPEPVYEPGPDPYRHLRVAE